MQHEEWGDPFVKHLLSNEACYGVDHAWGYTEEGFRSLNEPLQSNRKAAQKALSMLENGGTVSFPQTNDYREDFFRVTRDAGLEQCDTILSAAGAHFGEMNEAFKTTFYVQRGAVKLLLPQGEVLLAKGHTYRLDGLSWHATALENTVMFKFTDKPSYKDNYKYKLDGELLNGYFDKQS